MKTCRICLVSKPLEDFYKSANYKGGRRHECKKCIRSMEKSRKELRSKEDRIRYARTAQVKLYGLTPKTYQEMVDRQDGLCAICRQPPVRDRYLAVDHNRACCNNTGSCGNCVRSLLCVKCNSALGMVNDDVLILQAMIEYLKSH